jgi:ligand-binding sensor domain-containing protein/two-component sensor histidine kinase
LLSDEERLWVGTTEGGLAVMASALPRGKFGVSRILTAADGLPSSWINEIRKTSDGAVWVATDGGLARIRPDAANCRNSSCADSIAAGLTSSALSLAEDRSRNLWVGTKTGAAHVLTAGFAVFSTSDGIPAASSLLSTRDGVVVAMTAGATREGAAWFDGQRFQSIRLPVAVADTSWGWNQVLVAARDGDWWVGTRAGALRLRGVDDMKRLYRARERRLFSTSDGLAANVVLRLFEDSRGDVWIATVGEGKPHGLTRWERSTDMLHHYQSRQGLPDLGLHFVSAFAEDGSGGLWLGFSGDAGLARIRRGEIDQFSGQDLQQIGTIRNLFVSSNGTLWGATSRGGLLRVDNPSSDRPRLSRLTMAEGLSSNEVGAVVEDDAGRIYAGTARGIDRIAPAEQQISRHGAADGIPVGEVYAAIKDRQGTLWFGYSGGIVRFTPTDARPRAIPFVLIDGLSVDEQRQRVSALGQDDLGRLELAPGRTALQVSYLAPGFGPMDGVRYQIRLEGVDQDWSPPSEQRTVNYANIGPGRYRFAVRAVTAEGVLSSNTAGFEFRVLTPLWQRWWFLSTAFILCAVASYAFYRYRLARVLRVAAMRGRIARDLHDDIGANLTRIAVLAEVVRRQEAVPTAADVPLSSIANVARQSMSAMGDIVWAVNPDRDRVGDLAQRMREYAEEVFAAHEVSLTFTVPELLKDLRLEPELRRDLYLVVKEATNNAARHSNCTRFSVEMRRTRESLAMTVVDDGHGFDVTAADGNGLSNMRRRLALLEGRFEVDSGPGRGTRIVLEIPLRRRTRLFR